MLTHSAGTASGSRIDASAVFAPWREARGIVVAASGGPDSTALMVLVAGWTERPPILVVTIDHGLRSEGADEAIQVQRNAAALGLPWRGIRLEGIGHGGNLQARARGARYRSLAEAAVAAGFDSVATAHHRDDQAETFLLRLARGSGVYGLGAMRTESLAGGVRLVRPLLHLSRDDLVEVARLSGLPVALDPSNLDPRFDRVRLRALMPSLADQGLSPDRLAGTAARLARAADALDGVATGILRTYFSADRFGLVRGPLAPLLAAHEEIALRILSRIVTAAGGAEYAPPEAQMERLLASLRQSRVGAMRRTVHGVEIVSAAGALAVHREWGRKGLPQQAVCSSAAATWDGRYRIRIPATIEADAIGPLGDANFPVRSPGAGHRILRTIPGIFHAGSLVAVPPDVRNRDRKTAQPKVFQAECLVGARLGLLPEGSATGNAAPELTELAGKACLPTADTVSLRSSLQQPI